MKKMRKIKLITILTKKDNVRKIQIILLLTLLLAISILVVSYILEKQVYSPIVVVIRDSNIRELPLPGTKKLGVVRINEIFYVKQIDCDYCYIVAQYQNKLIKGWIYKKNLIRKGNRFYTKVDSNVGIEYKSKNKIVIPKGIEVKILDFMPTWIRIDKGWISAENAKLQGKFKDLVKLLKINEL